MKKLLILLDTDDWKKIDIVRKNFLKTDFTFMSKGIMEIWEIDEENNMVRRI